MTLKKLGGGKLIFSIDLKNLLWRPFHPHTHPIYAYMTWSKWLGLSEKEPPGGGSEGTKKAIITIPSTRKKQR